MYGAASSKDGSPQREHRLTGADGFDGRGLDECPRVQRAPVVACDDVGLVNGELSVWVFSHVGEADFAEFCQGRLVAIHRRRLEWTKVSCWSSVVFFRFEVSSNPKPRLPSGSLSSTPGRPHWRDVLDWRCCGRCCLPMHESLCADPQSGARQTPVRLCRPLGELCFG